MLPDTLNQNHHDTAKLVAKGISNKQIVKHIGISESTLLRWKREPRFKELIQSYLPKGRIDEAVQAQQQNYNLLLDARESEMILTAELRESLEKVIAIIKERLESMEEEEIKDLPLRLLSPLIKCFADGFDLVQRSHDRLTGYGLLIKQLEDILEGDNSQTPIDS